MLKVNTLPKKAGKSKADQGRESAPDFAEARRHYPAFESAVNNLNHRGLDRVRTRKELLTLLTQIAETDCQRLENCT